MNDDCPFDGKIRTDTPAALPQREPPDKSDSEIDRIANTPMESLAFKDFASLKSGRDAYSKMKLADLKDAVSHADWTVVNSAFLQDEKTQASCLRWILRGLSVDKAIRKIKTDMEIAEKARSGRSR